MEHVVVSEAVTNNAVMNNAGNSLVFATDTSNAQPFLTLLLADLVGRLFFQSGRFACQFEFRARRVVFDVVGEIPRAWQRLAGDVHLTAGRSERREHHQPGKQPRRAAPCLVDSKLKQRGIHLSLLLTEGLRPMHVIGQHSPYRPPDPQTFAHPESFSCQ